MGASIRGRRGSHCVSDDQRSRHSLTVEYNQAIPSPIAINATENFKNEFVTESIVFNCASRQDQRNGKRTSERESDHSIRKIVKAGRLSLDTLTHQKAPKKSSPRPRLIPGASIELVRIRLCRVGSDALQLSPQYASGFPKDERASWKGTREG